MRSPYRFQKNTTSFAYFWSSGQGAVLLKRLGYLPEWEKAAERIPLLFEVDTAADEVVTKLHGTVGFARGQELLAAYIAAPDSVPEGHRDLLHGFFASFPIEPEWLNRELLADGLAFSQRSGISGLVVLRDYCLMGGYESAAINKPLVYTGALKKGAVKRIAETVEFWVDVTGDDALNYGEIGFHAVMKTRMIHSFSRLNILKYSDWNSDKWGMPLNFWDMLATNLGFSLVFLNGLSLMGINPTQNEIKGVLHLWKYVGYLLGIPVNLLPDSEEQAIQELYYWTMTQAPGDADSKALAHALQEEPIRAFYPTHRPGRWVMREVHLFYNRFLLGNYSCNLLQLDTTRIGKLAWFSVLKNKRTNRVSGGAASRSKLIRKGRRTHEEVKAIYLKWNR